MGIKVVQCALSYYYITLRSAVGGIPLLGGCVKTRISLNNGINPQQVRTGYVSDAFNIWGALRKVFTLSPYAADLGINDVELTY